MRGDKFGSNCKVLNNSGSGTIDANCYVEVLNNTGFTSKVCTPIADYAADPDSLCWGAVCFPNTDKQQAKCFATNGLPTVKFTNPDTIILSNQSTVRLDIQQISGLIDSIVIFNNNSKILKFNALPAFVDVPINDYQNHFFRMQAFGCSQLYPYHTNSNSVMVYKIQNFNIETQLEVPFNTVGFTVSPNPAQNVLQVQTEIGSKVSIYTLAGQLINTILTDTANQSIDVSNLKSSLYLIEVLTPQGQFMVHKFIKI